MPPIRTCDQCYSKKKKCQRQIDLAKCVRCTHLALSCSTVRHSRPPGRPARAKALGPAAEVQVWTSQDLSPTLESSSSQTPREQTISPTLQRVSPESARRRNDTVEPGASESQLVKLPDILQELGSAYFRDNVAPEPTDEEFYQLNDIFMIGPSFTRSFRKALNYSYLTATHILKDMFSVMIRYMTTTNKPKIPVPAHGEIAQVADLLRKSQVTEVSSSNDALAFLVLGQSLAALDTFLVSAGSMLILRHTLYLAKPWYPELAQNEFLDSVTVTPICWEILECLLKREVPIIRPLIHRPQVVDRLFGACVSLMPMLYDLCEVSHNLRLRPQNESPELQTVERHVLSWKPDEASISESGFTDSEMMLLRAQASIYRSAALLLIHRIKYPLGSQDGIAVSYANDIMEEKDKILLHGGPDIKLQFGCFAFFLALLEIPLRPEALWKSLTKLSYCPACAEQFFAFHKYYWQQRWEGYKGSIFDLIESGPPFMAVP
ncbi:hypothetical protein N7539_003299 [Penicillium diatomitis]|uniref:Zn(2)-C6 fungal-type domain-containing protein n=1 Tax=Penicillium diatomitis TaxID=2819901 RepID=A0A9W9XGH3_9EURO|nr:uncharacterized protein N7539_003299 [Penicillium diatomitis]KAJ5491732.1 hypothetical protein N7539_003299 [Penicillium diatomitis]